MNICWCGIGFYPEIGGVCFLFKCIFRVLGSRLYTIVCVCVCVCRASTCTYAGEPASRQATAATSAAPRPEPSSDSIRSKEISGLTN